MRLLLHSKNWTPSRNSERRRSWGVPGGPVLAVVLAFGTVSADRPFLTSKRRAKNWRYPRLTSLKPVLDNLGLADDP